MEIKNRLAVSPMVTNYCEKSGKATDRFVAYHEEKARGGWGLILTENYAVTPDARGFSCVAGLYEDAQIEGHARVPEAVHRHGAKIVAQMVHSGRQTNHRMNTGVQVVAPSAIPCPGQPGTSPRAHRRGDPPDGRAGSATLRSASRRRGSMGWRSTADTDT